MTHLPAAGTAMEIYKEFGFEAAHRLPNAPENHKCRRLHGHSFRVSVHVDGAVGAESGWVQDFAELADIVDPVVGELDHRYLNEIQGLANPTSEVLAMWIWDRLVHGLPGLSRVIIRETCTTGCVYDGR